MSIQVASATLSFFYCTSSECQSSEDPKRFLSVQDRVPSIMVTWGPFELRQR